MQQQYPSMLLEQAVAEISKLPGIGRKTALRLVLHMLRRDAKEIHALGNSLTRLVDEVKYCRTCHNICDKEECDMDADTVMMIALDAGAEDFAEEEDSFEILTAPDDCETVRQALEKEGIKMAQAEVTMLPQNYVELTSEDDIKKINKILDLLDEDDDVQAVYHNWDE